jgi:hypothetical protein
MAEPRYYAECVDLVRKLVLSGLIGLINPGTVFQSFCSVRPYIFARLVGENIHRSTMSLTRFGVPSV